MFSVRLLLAKLPDLGAQRGLGGRVGFLCLFKKQARMSMVTSVQVFGSPVILHCVYMYVGKCHISEAEGLKECEIFKVKCLKGRGLLQHLN